MPEEPPFRDVRMRGFQDRAGLDEVRAWVDGRPVAARAEMVALDAARGRVLARELVTDVDVPAFARAAMDGWAVRGEDTFGASATDPVVLRVVGRSFPGATPSAPVGRGEAVRIMTGAPLPDGADAVLRAEHGREVEGRLDVREAVAPSRHVGRVGEDVEAGSRLLATGRVLRPQDLGLAASIGRDHLEVLAPPRVSLLVTGDELLPPGSRPTGSRIADANTPLLEALVTRDGGTVVEHRHVPDRASAVEAAITGAEGDVVLVSGGSSVGEEDHAPRVVATRGTLVHHGVRLRPASPVGVGTIGDRTVFLLPGNPVSCLCAYDLLAGRLVRRAAGRSPELPYGMRGVDLARKVSSALGRVDYVRVALNDEGLAEPVMSRGASILSSTTEADGFALVPEDSEGWPEGARIVVHLY